MFEDNANLTEFLHNEHMMNNLFAYAHAAHGSELAALEQTRKYAFGLISQFDAIKKAINGPVGQANQDNLEQYATHSAKIERERHNMDRIIVQRYKSLAHSLDMRVEFFGQHNFSQEALEQSEFFVDDGRRIVTYTPTARRKRELAKPITRTHLTLLSDLFKNTYLEEIQKRVEVYDILAGKNHDDFVVKNGTDAIDDRIGEFVHMWEVGRDLQPVAEEFYLGQATFVIPYSEKGSTRTIVTELIVDGCGAQDVRSEAYYTSLDHFDVRPIGTLMRVHIHPEIAEGRHKELVLDKVVPLLCNRYAQQILSH